MNRVINHPESVGLFYLDSGAHSLYNIKVRDYVDPDKAPPPHFSTNEERRSYRYRFYDTQEFWEYVDDFADYLKPRLHVFDYYTNVDAIFDPKRTWRIQKYMEEAHGLNPMPVIHFGTELKWIKKYLDHGYSYLGIGGLGQEVSRQAYYAWGDRVFKYISKDGVPQVKTHGFAITAHELLFRYPWASVDSSSWVKAGAYGMVFIPKWKKEKNKVTWVFDDSFRYRPRLLCFSEFLPKKYDARHYRNMNKYEREEMHRWFDFIQVPLGTYEEKESGILTSYTWRNIANLRYFEMLTKALPPWPWRFVAKEGVEGLVRLPESEYGGLERFYRPRQMVLCYSGQMSGLSLPERALWNKEPLYGAKATGPALMFTYYDVLLSRSNCTARIGRHAKRREAMLNETGKKIQMHK